MIKDITVKYLRLLPYSGIVNSSMPVTVTVYLVRSDLYLVCNPYQNPDENVALYSGQPHWFKSAFQLAISEQLNQSKTGNLKHSNLVFGWFFRAQNVLWAESGGNNVNVLVSLLNCMDFSSVNWLSYLKSEISLPVCYLDAGLKRYERKKHWSLNLPTCESQN